MEQRTEIGISRPFRTERQNNAAQDTRQTSRGYSGETTEGPLRTHTATRISKQRGKQVNARRSHCKSTRKKKKTFSCSLR